MRTRRMVTSSLLVAAFAAVLSPSLAVTHTAPPRTPDQLVRDAVALYAKKGAPVWPAKANTDASQALRDAHMRAAAAQARWSRMPAATIRQELSPLLARLRPDSVSYTAVAYALAYNGVDVPRNVEIIRRSLSPVPVANGHEYWQPKGGSAELPVSAEYTFPALANLYRHTRNPAILDALLHPTGLDGAGVAFHSDAMLHLVRDYPEAVIHRAARTKEATNTLVSALADRDFLKEQRDIVRPSLKRIASGKDKAMARVARRSLEEMNATGRWQAQSARR